MLHIFPNPLTAEEICDTLDLARSNVSNGLKELQSWKLVKSSRQLGDRRDHFTSVRDMFDLVTVVVEGRREREFAPPLAALRETAKQAATDDTPAVVRARIDEALNTMQMFDDWYTDVSRLNRTVQLGVIKLGQKSPDSCRKANLKVLPRRTPFHLKNLPGNFSNDRNDRTYRITPLPRRIRPTPFDRPGGVLCRIDLRAAFGNRRNLLANHPGIRVNYQRPRLSVHRHTVAFVAPEPP